MFVCKRAKCQLWRLLKLKRSICRNAKRLSIWSPVYMSKYVCVWVCVGVGLFVRQCLLLFLRCHLFKFNECIAAFLALANVTPETFVNRGERGKRQRPRDRRRRGHELGMGFHFEIKFQSISFCCAELGLGPKWMSTLFLFFLVFGHDWLKKLIYQNYNAHTHTQAHTRTLHSDSSRCATDRETKQSHVKFELSY